MTRKTQFSLLIIVKGREAHLRNVLRSLKWCTRRPTEVIVVHMNEPVGEYHIDIPIREYSLWSESPLPLAEGRNLAAQKANNDHIIFLDVDCIPNFDCFEILMNDLTKTKLVMANPKYLTKPVTNNISFERLENESRINTARDGLAFGESNDYSMFWSLGFAIRKHDFDRIGGFDERYTGYGAEDTDFAFTARDAKLSVSYSEAIVYHQNHDSYDPPLNWLKDIVQNANTFYEKWGTWPMQGWLDAFESMNFISLNDKTITMLRQPSESEVSSCLKHDAL